MSIQYPDSLMCQNIFNSRRFNMINTEQSIITHEDITSKIWDAKLWWSQMIVVITHKAYFFIEHWQSKGINPKWAWSSPYWDPTVARQFVQVQHERSERCGYQIWRYIYIYRYVRGNIPRKYGTFDLHLRSWNSTRRLLRTRCWPRLRPRTTSNDCSSKWNAHPIRAWIILLYTLNTCIYIYINIIYIYVYIYINNIYIYI